MRLKFWKKDPVPAKKAPQTKGTWRIDKSFSFCYGHRVFNQVINTDLTERGHTCAKCRRLHGHEGLVKVFLKGTELNFQGMVEDFVNLGWIKNFLDDNIDHCFILSLQDPWFVNIINAVPLYDTPPSGDVLVGLRPVNPLNTSDQKDINIKRVYVPGTDHLAGYVLDVDSMSGPEREFFEGFFLVNFVPTSENLSRWLFDIVDVKMSMIGIQVSRIDWFETPKSRSSYSRS